ncbi:MAG: glycerophosphodiester phosphodiesterase family protein, partial [Nitrospiria bacterium]
MGAESMRIPQLVAHRGYAACFPENTLLSMAKAVESGARFLECDVQLCADGTPVLFHDASLERTTGVQKNLLDCSYATVQSLDTCERSKFGERFVGQGLTIPALADFITFLKSVPQVRTFIELKNESLRRHGVDAVLDIVFPIIQPAFKQCILIAYDAQVLRAARKRGVHQCGWVLTTWDNASHQEAKILAPDILIS